MDKINWNRTDLIDESEEIVSHRTKLEQQKLEQQDGVIFTEGQTKRVKITKVEVDEQGAAAIQKKSGQYITLTIPTLTVDDDDGLQQLEKSLIQALKEMHQSIKFTKQDKILVIGLGNKTITPDAVGPFTIDAMQKEKIELDGDPFILFAPGVTGQTGYETSEFVKALADKIKPALIIIVDALATRGSDRLCRTIQLTDTGIHPGSGVGNERAEISYESMGIPVSAIGIPTVVGGPVLVSDAVERVFRSIAAKIHERGKPSSKLSVTPFTPSDEPIDMSVAETIFGEWVNWPKEDRQQLFQEVLSNQVDQLIVTPKEVDIWVIHYSIIVTNALFAWAESSIPKAE